MSLGVRAALALVLLAGFYFLGLTLVVVLLGFPLVEIGVLHRVNLQLTVFCVVTGAILAWSLVPRRHRFTAPGPLLTREDQPRLFAEIDALARHLGEEGPSEVYLVPDVNAFVMHRGGFLGLGSKRVLGVGLALVQTLTVGEFRSVLAHEFGHYRGGDTALGPLVHRTRQTIGRTVQNLGDSVLNVVMVAYFKLFLRVSAAVSRAQEFEADRTSVLVAGRTCVASSLTKVHTVAPAFDAYLKNELFPSLNAGGRPPVAEGFARFLHAPQVREAVEKQGREEGAADRRSGDWDSHPTLAERLAALETAPEGTTWSDGGDMPAVELLDRLSDLENRLLAHQFSAEAVKDLKAVDWTTVGTEVFLPHWRSLLTRFSEVTPGLPLAELPFLTKESEAARRLQTLGEVPAGEEAWQGFLRFLVGTGLSVALAESGWTLECLPGLPVRTVRRAESVLPVEEARAVLEGGTDRQVWAAKLAEWGVSGWNWP